MFVTIQGRQQYLWRAVDEDGDVLDILVQSQRNRLAAVRFFRTLLKAQGRIPRRLITDQLRSYAAAGRTVMPSVVHVTDQYANNRAEVSHQPTRQRERQIRRFKSAAQLQRFASVHGIVQNLFRVSRHLLRSAHHRLLRTRAFVRMGCGYVRLLRTIGSVDFTGQERATLPAIVIDVTREDWPGGRQTFRPLRPEQEAEPNQDTFWFGARFSPAGIEVWFRITYEAIQGMQEDTPQSRGARLVECLIAWRRDDPDRQLEDLNRFQVYVSNAGDTRIEPYGD